MPAYEYTALDADGRERRGLLEGDTPRHVRQLLREQNLMPVDVEEVVATEEKRRRAFHFRRGIPAADLALLTRQLATLVQSGLPLEEALLAVSQQNEKPRVQSIVAGVRSRVLEGRTRFAPGPRRVPAGLRRAVPRHRGGRRAVGPSRSRARAARRLHRGAPAAAEPDPQCHDLPGTARGGLAADRVGAARLRGARGGARVRGGPAAAAALDARADRTLGSVPPLVVAAVRRRRRCLLGIPARARQPGDPPPLRPFQAHAAADRACGTRRECGALRAHLRHSHLERGAGARGAAHRGRSRDQPADEGGGRRGRGTRARRGADRPLAGRALSRRCSCT